MKNKVRPEAVSATAAASKAGSRAEPAAPKKKHRALKLLLFACLTLLVLALVGGALVYFYSQYTKTHYEIYFIRLFDTM